MATYWLKIAYFSYPSLIRHPRSPCSLWNFAVKSSVLETSHLAILQWRPDDRSWSRFGMIPACDGRSDRIYHSKYSALHSKLCWRTV